MISVDDLTYYWRKFNVEYAKRKKLEQVNMDLNRKIKMMERKITALENGRGRR